MLFLEDKQHKMNPTEVAFAKEYIDVLVEMAECLPAIATKLSSVMHCVTNNVKLLMNGGKDKQSLSSLLGMEDVSTIISAEPCPDSGQSSSMISESQLSDAKSVREKGNVLFKLNKFNDAITTYEHAIALDPKCPLASSNAAEAALQLCDFTRALQYSLVALDIDHMHKKSWFRHVRGLGGLNRGSEAYIWIADLATKFKVSCIDQRCMCEAVSNISPCCYQFFPGLIIERRKGSRHYRVITTIPIESQTVLSKEVAVVPWTCEDVWNDAKMTKFVSEIKPSEVEMINGIFPRRFADIPTATVKSLGSLEEKLRAIKPNATEKDRRELCRILACAKLCSFDNGIHHFASFYDHSCEPNCEVRSVNNLEVVAARDIAAYEDLCISYMQADVLVYPAAARRGRSERG
jgi:tetratricopeptide (TPR) repeat protein